MTDLGCPFVGRLPRKVAAGLRCLAQGVPRFLELVDQEAGLVRHFQGVRDVQRVHSRDDLQCSFGEGRPGVGLVYRSIVKASPRFVRHGYGCYGTAAAAVEPSEGGTGEAWPVAALLQGEAVILQNEHDLSDEDASEKGGGLEYRYYRTARVQERVQFLRELGLSEENLSTLQCRAKTSLRSALLQISLKKLMNVVSFFRDEVGLSNAQAAKCLFDDFYLGSSSVDGSLRPKVQYFRQLGFSDEQMVKLVCRRPQILTCHLNRTIMPMTRKLTEIGLKDEDIVKVYLKSLCSIGATGWNIHHRAVVVSTSAICCRIKFTGLCSSFSHQAPGEAGQLDRELDVLFRMDQQGNVPSVDTYRSLLKRCAKRKALAQAKRVHAHLAEHGLEFATSVGEYVVSTLVKCGGLEDALQLFYRLPHRTVFSWSAVIDGYTVSGQGKEALNMYRWMLQEGVQPNTYTFVGLLKACSSISDLEEGKRMHFEALKYGCESDLFVGTCLLDMYGKCGSIVDAWNVFNRLSRRDVVSWNSMVSAYVEQQQAEKALQLYERMGQEGVSPNDRTFVSTLQACGMLAEKEEAVMVDGRPIKVKSLEKGWAIHADARRRRFDSDVFVGTTLVSMFGKCGSITDAQAAFDQLSCRDPGAWNSMLAATIENGEAEKALKLCRDMWDDGMSPNDRTFVSALQACAMLAEKEDSVMVDGLQTKVTSLEKGQAIHVHCRTKGYESDVFVGSALITMYGKCGRVEKAQGVFNRLPRRDVVAWTAMLAVYAEQGQLEQALQLYRGMQQEGFTPNEVTLVFVLQACSKAGSLGALRLMHQSLVIRAGSLSLPVANTLITGYGRCGSMVDALSVFDALSQPDVVSWNALIAAHARQGDSATCIQCYTRMKLVGMNPNAVTFLLLLSACSHGGLVDRGLEYFYSMSRDYNVTPGIDHYGSIVDLLGRAGRFTMIEDLLIHMQVQPDLQLWVHLLGACRKHGNVALGEHAFRCAVQLQPKVASSYVLMSNIYADAGMWDSAENVSRLRREAGAWKEAGHSWVEHERDTQTFMVGDYRQNV